jgi:hypothetical protein
MAETFIHSWPNLFSNGNVKIIGSGNPKHDPDDQLGIAAEPKEGWASVGEPLVTTTWKTRHMGGVCVNLVGTDSPNFRAVAKGLREPYPKLIGPRFAERIAHDWGADSPEYYSQVKGVMRIDMAVKRVITRMLCRDHGALGKVIWSGKPTTKVMGIDPSYGGGDACIEVILEWGEDVSGVEIIRVASWKQIKLNVSNGKSVEDQIADVVFEDLEREKIPFQNCFYDPYGKGTMGFAFSRRFPQGRSPIPVDSGGKPTPRPVRAGLFVDESDTFGITTKRLKRCDEHYSKFVSEAWFSVRYVIEAGQMRELPEDMMLEGSGRKYDTVAGNKIEVEPKDEMKERGLKSPNKFDALCFLGNTKILTPSGELTLDELKVGDWVSTPFGETQVAIIHAVPASDLRCLSMTNGRQLTGTPEHKVFTWDKGWIELDALSVDNELEPCENLPLWKLLNALFTRAKNTGFKRLANTLAATICGTGKKLHARDFFIESSGQSIMGLLRLGCASITKMVIGTITGSKIWSLLKREITQATTWLKTPISLSDSCGTLPQLEGFTPQYGMALRLESNGINLTERRLGWDVKLSPRSALCAEKISRRTSQAVESSAQIHVCNEQDDRNSRRLRDVVSFAVKAFSRIATTRVRIAPITVEPLLFPESRLVYNLTLVEHNVYYANGVLVQNCVALEGARQRGFKIGQLSNAVVADKEEDDFFAEEAKKWKDTIQSKLLKYA